MTCISLKTSIMGVTAICLSVAFTHDAMADAANCPSPIPLGLTTALTGNLALLGIQARNGVEFAVDEINASGGIDGKKLVADDGRYRRIEHRRAERDEPHHRKQAADYFRIDD